MKVQNFFLEPARMIPHPRLGAGMLQNTMNKVQLNNVDHSGLRLKCRHSAELGHSVNQLLLVPSEFEQAQREYPILFRRDADGEFQAVALLGLDRGENLFLSNERWNARYIPAIVRREPFFLAETEGDYGDSTLATFVDLDDPRLGDDDGEPLFLPLGGNSPSLDGALSALRAVQEGLLEAQAMFALFAELGLLQPVNLQMQLGDGLEYRIPDVFSIDAALLSSLSSEKLERLHRSGFLPHAIFARSSLANINRLIELKGEKLANG